MDASDQPDQARALALDLDLRKLRYFVAVAERLHFGRAAEALYITQPALSRQIRQLEHELGVALFARSSREVTLTPAGEQLAREAPRLLATSQAAVTNTRRAGKSDRSLTVGFMLGTDLDPTLRAFSRRHPDTDIQLKRIRWWNQTRALLEGGVDVAFVRLPIDTEGLRLLPLYTEPLQVALPRDHPLASETAVSIADLADDPVLVYADASPTWNAVWTIDPRPDGSHPRQGPIVRDMEEILEYVKAGRGVIFLPSAISEAFPRPDVAYVPITDIPPGQIALAWNETQSSLLVTELIEVATADRVSSG
jgi:DNA-binding transcriptional LysR family regulator